MNIKLGKIWKSIRQTSGLTQEKVSEEIDLGPRYISDLERDITIGSIPVLIKLCNLYQVTPTLVLQDYLDIKDDFKLPAEFLNINKLSNRDKELVLDLIRKMLSTKE